MKKIAVVRGKFLNRYEMQFFEPLVNYFDIVGFGSLTPFHDTYSFPVKKLACPMDVVDFPYKMPILNRMFTDAHYLLGLEKELAGFDLVHTAETYFRYTQQCLDAKKMGYVRKVIATVLENIPFNNENISGRQKYKKRAREELDHIIALTEKTKHALVVEGTDPKKITILPHFIDTARFHPLKHKAIRIDGKKRIVRVLFVGRLEEYKGIFDMVEVLDSLVGDEDLKPYILEGVFVGSGSKKGELKTMSHNKKWRAMFFEASYDHMPAVYNDADIFIAPSKPTPTWEEQYSTVLLEAQASGLPIITTNTGGIPENIGSAGVLVPPGAIRELKNALKEFVLSPSKRAMFGKRARIRSTRVHDAQIGARRLLALYQEVLNS